MQAFIHSILSLVVANLAVLEITAKPPIDVKGFFDDLLILVRAILGAVGTIYFLIDMIRHIGTTPRDMVAIGKDILAMIVIIGLAWKADEILKWGQTIF